MTQQFQGVKNSVDEVQIALVIETVTSMMMQMTALTKNKARKRENTKLLKENSNLKTEIGVPRNQVQDIQQYSRRDDIEIIGVTYTQTESMYIVVDQVA